jgi:hypothetical protein
MVRKSKTSFLGHVFEILSATYLGRIRPIKSANRPRNDLLRANDHFAVQAHPADIDEFSSIAILHEWRKNGGATMGSDACNFWYQGLSTNQELLGGPTCPVKQVTESKQLTAQMAIGNDDCYNRYAERIPTEYGVNESSLL